MAEIAGPMREGLLALAVRTGLKVMWVPMEAEVTAPPGVKRSPGARPERGPLRPRTRLSDPGRAADPGEQAAGGRRRCPGKLPVATYALVPRHPDPRGDGDYSMLAGLATRRWPNALEPVGQQISAAASATSKSTVSWRRRSG
jgi:putative transposase